MPWAPGDPRSTDLSGRTVPPYEGRQEGAHVDSEEERRPEGATVGGATGPVESSDREAPEPADTPRGTVASPADELPAEDSPAGESEEASVGPAHVPGTTRGEDVGKGKHRQDDDAERNVGG